VNWDAIGAIAELVGAAGVVASLVYLTSQIRSNSRSVEAATSHSIARARNEIKILAQPGLDAWWRSHGHGLSASFREEVNSAIRSRVEPAAHRLAGPRDQDGAEPNT
jgi:hypothetical protein